MTDRATSITRRPVLVGLGSTSGLTGKAGRFTPRLQRRDTEAHASARLDHPGVVRRYVHYWVSHLADLLLTEPPDIVHQVLIVAHDAPA